MSEKEEKPPLVASLTPLTCLELLPYLNSAQVTREFQNLRLVDNNFTIDYKRRALFKHFDMRISSEFDGSTVSCIWGMLNKNQKGLSVLEGQIRDVNNSVRSLRGHIKRASINASVGPSETIQRKIYTNAQSCTEFSSTAESMNVSTLMTNEEYGKPLETSEVIVKKVASKFPSWDDEEEHSVQRSNSQRTVREVHKDRRRLSSEPAGDRWRRCARKIPSLSAFRRKSLRQSCDVSPCNGWRHFNFLVSQSCCIMSKYLFRAGLSIKCKE